MKRTLTLFAAILLLAVGATAQKLSYQAVVRNDANELVTETTVQVAVTVLDANNAVQYSETHANVQTNRNGLLSLMIGDGVANGSTTLSDVEWSGASVRTVITLPDGSTITNVTPVNPLPYALYAENVSPEALLAAVNAMTAEQKAALNDILFFECGTSKMTDADGNEYETVQIGTQCWTKTNLRVAPAGATDATSSGAYSNTEPYYYVKPGFDAATNGYYYNWEAAKLACPSGWHLPSDAEWNTLEATVSGSDWQESYVTATAYRGSHAGKLAGDGWNSSSTAGAPGNAADANHNASGFSAVPAGFWSYGFDYAGNDAYFWSSTEDGAGSAWHRILYYSYAGVLRTTSSRYGGFSVRCLRD